MIKSESSDVMSNIQKSDLWKTKDDIDLLEPELQPDPLLLRAGLEKSVKDDQEQMKNIAQNQAVHRALALFFKGKKADQYSYLRLQDVEGSRAHINSRGAQPSVAFGPDLSEKSSLISSIQETAGILKDLLKASNVVSYIVNPSKKEIYSPQKAASSTTQLKYKVEPFTTMPAHTAFTKQQLTSDTVRNDKRFTQEARFSASSKTFSTCIPIKTPDDYVVAVYEILIDKTVSKFDKRDLQKVLAVTNWMGVAIHQNYLFSTLSRQDELNDYLSQLTNHHHTDHTLVNRTLSDILVFAREVIVAEQCSLYVIDSQTEGSLLVEEYQQGVGNPRILFKKRSKKLVCKDDSVLSTVLFKKEVVNSCNDHESSLSLNDLVRSVLCVPIVDNNHVIGAIQLVNKRISPTFNKEDEETLQQFANFLPMNLSHLKCHEKMKHCEVQTKVMEEMLLHQIKPCNHNQGSGIKKNKGNLPEDLFSLSWYPSLDHMPKLAELTISMFQEVLGDPFMSLNNVPNFILTVKNCYRPNPYHNFLHAFCVTHTMANIISRYHRYFTGVERKALLVAALCHDVDHRGYTNNFIHLTKHYLSRLYDSSPLENHHFTVTKMILQQCEMFSYIQPEIFNELLTEIYECIIATDLSLYFQCRMELMKVADEKIFSFKNASHRKLVKSMIMTACDLSGQTKPFPICKKITEDLYEEFYQQGDIEKRMGFIPLPTMDREKSDMIAQNQVQFLTVVVLPCVEAVCRFFGNLNPMLSECKVLLHQWKELAKNQEHCNVQGS